MPAEGGYTSRVNADITRHVIDQRVESSFLELGNSWIRIRLKCCPRRETTLVRDDILVCQFNSTTEGLKRGIRRDRN